MLDCGNALFFSLVSQHGAGAHVANSIDVGNVSLPMIVGDDLVALVHLDTSVLEAKAIGEGTATNAD